MSEQQATDSGVTAAAGKARLRVGEHVGLAAGDAAQAIRRAGLRPGLERSFGHPAELVGQVVAQEPPAGSDLARNGLVTIYVAAPGTGGDEKEPVEEPGSGLPASLDRSPGGDARLAAVEDEQPRPAAGEIEAEDDDRADSAVAATGFDDQTPGDTLDGGERGAVPVEPAGEAQEPETVELGAVSEEAIARAQELFAGRGGPRRRSWRRSPRRGCDVTTTELRARLGGRRWLVRGACGVLGGWLIVGILVAAIGGAAKPSQRRAAASAGVHRVGGARTTAGSRGPAAVSAHGGGRRSAARRLLGAGSQGQRRGPATAKSKRYCASRDRLRSSSQRRRGVAVARSATPASGVTPAAVAPAGVDSPSPPVPEAAAPESAPAAPESEAPVQNTPEQIGGGPFSP